MECLDTRVGWPTTHMDDEFVMRSVRYLAGAGYRDEAIVATLTRELGVDLTRAMRIVAAARTDRVASVAFHQSLDRDPPPAADDAGDEFPPAA